MTIHKSIRFKGAYGESIRQSLIDTGAEILLIPRELAVNIGAWHTNQTVNIVGFHGYSSDLPLGKVGIFFSELGNKGGYFLVAVSNIEKEPVIGMDVLKPLGISIDTRTGKLSIKNEIWEAFKTISGVGVVLFLGVKVLETIFEEDL